MTQATLFEPYRGEPPFVATSETSRAAAESVAGDSTAWRAVILRLIAARSGYNGPVGATCDEVEVALAMRHQTASARIRELYLLGRIRKDGTRATRSGRQAAVYVAV